MSHRLCESPSLQQHSTLPSCSTLLQHIPDVVAPARLCGPVQVYVILFGVGQKHTSEGIYSLRGLTPEGLPLETIIAFECEEDAER